MFMPIKPTPPSHLPTTNYSFKVVFRVFRDFHSVPVKPLICSNWNIQHNVPAGTLGSGLERQAAARSSFTAGEICLGLS
jgi:hypothetical protein